ncbi:MAG: L,D-transpeptidase family protein [Verrucomicrobiales bacterium]|nr:L,D-transpeptidase family protein [Verrucomicrobiales bacterium]
MIPFLRFTRRRLQAAILILLIVSGEQSPAQDWTTHCRQVILVVTDNWASARGTLHTFHHRNGSWKTEGRPTPVMVGRKGLGWGLGLHRERTGKPQKHEGDQRAPAGIFRLEFGFGAEPLPKGSFPYRQVFPRDRWVDDPASSFYNQWVVADDSRFPKDWTSAEKLKRSDGIYDHVIVVAHNRSQIRPGRGSAIFLHRWYGPGHPTIGCTAMGKNRMIGLLKWLNAEEYPILIQIPAFELKTLEMPDPLRNQIEQNIRP